MQKTIYTCDNCEKAFGEKRHLSLSFGRFSGVALPPGDLPRGEEKSANEVVDEKIREDYMPRWKVVRTDIQGRLYHFCNAVCLQRFFSSLMRRA